MKKKWLWIGQRISDGIMYSRALSGLDVFFSCDSIKCQPDSFKSYSLSTNMVASNEQHKWTSKDISKIVNCHFNEINRYLIDGYNIFPYYLSTDSLEKISGSNNLFNKKVFGNQLTRPIQMYLCSQAEVRTPRWAIPHNMTWNNLVSLLGDTIVLQFDNTSSGLGTFVVRNEIEYKWFCDFLGQADLATEYLGASFPCSVHLWITKDSIAISPASVQIIECLKFHKDIDIQMFTFKGNDFGFYSHVIGLNKDIDNQLYKIGLLYQKLGVWGLIGVDYIIKDSMFYYTETNFRLQNSTSLLSFIQPTDGGNVVNCLMPDFLGFSDAGCTYQYFTSIPTTHLESGYYSTDGNYIGKATASAPTTKSNFLIFSNMPFGLQQQVRIIGFEIGCEGNGVIKKEIDNFLKRLVMIHG